MTKGCTCVQHDQTLEDAAKLMSKEQVGALPICGPDDKLIGMLTDRDIVVSAVAKGKNPSSVTAKELASGTIHWVRDDQSASEALELMEQQAIRRVPVIDSKRQLCGVIAQADIARELDARETGQLLEQISTAKPTRA